MATEKNISNLVINKVENKSVYNYMVQNNLVNDDELYLINDDELESLVTQIIVNESVTNNVKNYSSNIPYSDILKYIKNNNYPVCKFIDSSNNIYICNFNTYNETQGIIKFVGNNISNETIYLVTIKSNGTVEVIEDSTSSTVTVIDH